MKTHPKPFNPLPLLQKAFWDLDVEPSALLNMLHERSLQPPPIERELLLRRILSTFDWYTILKLLPPAALHEALDERIVARIWPADLRERLRYARQILQIEELVLKVDIANDIQVHFGELTAAPFFGRIDGWRNILSNKICALTRSEVKDIVDILCLAGSYDFEWEEILDEARQKDLWVEPLGVSRLLQSFPSQRLGDVRWIAPMDPALLQAALKQMHHDLFHGQPNSLQGRYSQWIRSDTASS